jgi:hypothetical protein
MHFLTHSMRVAVRIRTPWKIPFASKQVQKGKSSDRINDTVATTLKLYHSIVYEWRSFSKWRRMQSFL